MNDETESSNKKHVVGEAMQKLMAERGCYLTLGESRQFVLDLLRLVELGAIVPIEPPPAVELDVTHIGLASLIQNEEAATP